MEFRLLGPLEIVERDRSLALGAGKQKALRLIGAAADHREDGRDASRLLADAWTSRPPASAARTR
jgi:DNA-binding SARP family transcriptional activator